MSRVTCHISISMGPVTSSTWPPGRPAQAHGALHHGPQHVRPGARAWHGDWRGWWGDEPPYHAPVFVLTHHEHDPIPMDGGTIFHFITRGFDGALERTAAAAGDQEIATAGGASTVRQALAGRALDELALDIVPVLLHRGERMFDGVVDPGLRPIAVADSPRATHVRYQVDR
jgi:dihydrofolate reductase